MKKRKKNGASIAEMNVVHEAQIVEWRDFTHN